MPTLDADERVDRVLLAVSLVPRGRVVSYGDIAGLVGTGPRQVGRVMARWGSDVCWWRVTNHVGALPEHLLDAAVERWHAEGIPVARGRCRIDACRADLVELADAYEAAVAEPTDDDGPDARGRRDRAGASG